MVRIAEGLRYLFTGPEASDAGMNMLRRKSQTSSRRRPIQIHMSAALTYASFPSVIQRNDDTLLVAS